MEMWVKFIDGYKCKGTPNMENDSMVRKDFFKYFAIMINFFFDIIIFNFNI